MPPNGILTRRTTTIRDSLSRCADATSRNRVFVRASCSSNVARQEKHQVPIFEYRTAFEIARNIKAFLNLEVGLIRNGSRGSRKPKSRDAGSGGSQPPLAGEEPNGLRAGSTPARSATRGVTDEVVPMFILVGRSKSGTSWLM